MRTVRRGRKRSVIEDRQSTHEKNQNHGGVKMKDPFINKVGVWGRRHYEYLKRHSPTVINAMRLEGSLERYITDFDRDTQEMYDHMVSQYVEIEGITEEMKDENNLEWSRRMNSIRNRVEEFILRDQVYN